MAEISEIGFIQKINSIYPKIDTIVERGELFSDEVVETLLYHLFPEDVN